jgi:hypothetical protein
MTTYIKIANAKFGTVKKVISYLKQFYHEQFSPVLFFSIMIFSATGVYFNYFHPFLEAKSDELAWNNFIFLYYFLLYAIPFIGSFLLQALITGKLEHLSEPKFWFLVIFALSIFTIRSCSHIYGQFIYELVQKERLDIYWYRVIQTIFRMLIILIPITAYWFFTDRKNQPLYGFTLKNYDTRPYLIMLLVMVPLIAWASFQSDFLGTYPRGGELPGLTFGHQPDHKFFVLYEFLYGIDFIFIEFFFRGFLILAFAAIAGPSVILPMASFYVFIHFGKPLGETISSFFGGTLLGIIAYYSRSIAGGIIVHMGIAWMMEIGALLSKLYK